MPFDGFKKHSGKYTARPLSRSLSEWESINRLLPMDVPLAEGFPIAHSSFSRLGRPSTIGMPIVHGPVDLRPPLRRGGPTILTGVRSTTPDIASGVSFGSTPFSQLPTSPGKSYKTKRIISGSDVRKGDVIGDARNTIWKVRVPKEVDARFPTPKVIKGDWLGFPTRNPLSHGFREVGTSPYNYTIDGVSTLFPGMHPNAPKSITANIWGKMHILTPAEPISPFAASIRNRTQRRLVYGQFMAMKPSQLSIPYTTSSRRAVRSMSTMFGSSEIPSFHGEFTNEEKWFQHNIAAPLSRRRWRLADKYGVPVTEVENFLAGKGHTVTDRSAKSSRAYDKYKRELLQKWETKFPRSTVPSGLDAQSWYTYTRNAIPKGDEEVRRLLDTNIKTPYISFKEKQDLSLAIGIPTGKEVRASIRAAVAAAGTPSQKDAARRRAVGQAIYNLDQSLNYRSESVIAAKKANPKGFDKAFKALANRRDAAAFQTAFEANFKGKRQLLKSFGIESTGNINRGKLISVIQKLSIANNKISTFSIGSLQQHINTFDIGVVNQMSDKELMVMADEAMAFAIRSHTVRLYQPTWHVQFSEKSLGKGKYAEHNAYWDMVAGVREGEDSLRPANERLSTTKSVLYKMERSSAGVTTLQFHSPEVPHTIRLPGKKALNLGKLLANKLYDVTGFEKNTFMRNPYIDQNSLRFMQAMIGDGMEWSTKGWARLKNQSAFFNMYHMPSLPSREGNIVMKYLASKQRMAEGSRTWLRFTPKSLAELMEAQGELLKSQSSGGMSYVSESVEGRLGRATKHLSKAHEKLVALLERKTRKDVLEPFSEVLNKDLQRPSALLRGLLKLTGINSSQLGDTELVKIGNWLKLKAGGKGDEGSAEGFSAATRAAVTKLEAAFDSGKLPEIAGLSDLSRLPITKKDFVDFLGRSIKSLGRNPEEGAVNTAARRLDDIHSAFQKMYGKFFIEKDKEAALRKDNKWTVKYGSKKWGIPFEEIGEEIAAARQIVGGESQKHQLATAKEDKLTGKLPGEGSFGYEAKFTSGGTDVLENRAGDEQSVVDFVINKITGEEDEERRRVGARGKKAKGKKSRAFRASSAPVEEIVESSPESSARSLISKITTGEHQINVGHDKIVNGVQREKFVTARVGPKGTIELDVDSLHEGLLDHIASRRIPNDVVIDAPKKAIQSILGGNVAHTEFNSTFTDSQRQQPRFVAEQAREHAMGHYAKDMGPREAHAAISGTDATLIDIAKKLKIDRPLTFFDLETTGLSTENDRVVSLALSKVHPDGRVEHFSSLFNPGKKLPSELVKKLNLTNEELSTQPTFKSMAGKVANFFKGSDLAGYNIPHFDIPLLTEEFRRSGEQSPGLKASRAIDILDLFRRKVPAKDVQGYKLEHGVNYYLGKEHTGAHGARADVDATVDIFHKQIGAHDLPASVQGFVEHSKTWEPNWLSEGGRIIAGEGGKPTMNFFKEHVGKTLEEMAQKDPGTLRWISANSKFDADTVRHVNDALTNAGRSELISKKAISTREVAAKNRALKSEAIRKIASEGEAAMGDVLSDVIAPTASKRAAKRVTQSVEKKATSWIAKEGGELLSKAMQHKAGIGLGLGALLAAAVVKNNLSGPSVAPQLPMERGVPHMPASPSVGQAPVRIPSPSYNRANRSINVVDTTGGAINPQAYSPVPPGKYSIDLNVSDHSSTNDRIGDINKRERKRKSSFYNHDG